MPSFDVLLLRLLLVVLVGGLIGAEREYRSKSAGFRTMILICLGSFLFTSFGIFITGSTNDRIASNIVTGIGFLGAGVIFQSENRINGLTTAATIWITAALGMGIADGFYWLVLISTAIVLTSLFLLTKLENVIDKINQLRTYKIVSPYKENLLKDYESYFREHRLRFKRIKQSKIGNDITGSWIVQGSEKNHRKFVEHIMHDDTVKEFEF
ncbi:MAG TPA: MgtC/SapB family protein [Chitinophagaceae bacterium]|nr:MgtC/SapB family protein [Chitinophagaceae bacterium]